jgi:hypothetical protein
LIATKKSQEKKNSFITHTFIGAKRGVTSTQAEKNVALRAGTGKNSALTARYARDE